MNTIKFKKEDICAHAPQREKKSFLKNTRFLLSWQVKYNIHLNNNCESKKNKIKTASDNCNYFLPRRRDGFQMKYRDSAYLFYSLDIFTPFPSLAATPFFLMKCVSRLLHFSCFLTQFSCFLSDINHHHKTINSLLFFRTKLSHFSNTKHFVKSTKYLDIL